MDSKTAVIIPAYNAQETIYELIQKISQFIREEDIIVVEDGSTDDTLSELSRTRAKVLRHMQNQGKGEALKTGFKYALEKGYKNVITMDADLQHDPQFIPEFIMRADSGQAGIILGTRTVNVKTMPLERFLTNFLTSVIISAFSGAKVFDSQSGYRLISAEVLKSLRLISHKYDLESEILIKAGRKKFKIDHLPISTIYRGGRSFINPLVDTGRFIKVIWKSLWW